MVSLGPLAIRLSSLVAERVGGASCLGGSQSVGHVEVFALGATKDVDDFEPWFPSTLKETWTFEWGEV